MGYQLGILAALFLGVFFEGEIVLFSAVIAAHHDHLALWPVIVTSYAASLAMDLVFFGLGRSRGVQWIRNRRALKPRIIKAENFLEKNENIVIVSYRFLMGVRTIIPVLLGMKGMPLLRFTVLSIIGSVLWVVVIAFLGLVAGESILSLLGHIKDIEIYLIVALVLVALFVMFKKVRRFHLVRV